MAQTAGDKYSSTLVAGKSYYIRNRYTGKNLQPSNQVSANGTALVQYEPSISYYQKWTLQDAGDGYYYLTLGDASDRKLSVRGGSATANQPLELQTTLTDASKFRIEPSTEGIHYAIRSKLDNSMAVVSQSANTSNNNPIVMASYDGAGTEKEWYFVEATQSDYTAPVGGEVYYITNHLTNQVFDIPTFATNTGTALTQYAFMAGPNQQFKLEVSGDYILLVPQHSTDKAIAVGSDGTSLTLQNKNATDSNQQFQMTLLSNGAYRIVSRNYPNKTISQGSSVAQASAPLTLMNYTGEIWQQWRFTKPVDYTKSDVPESGEVYYIRFNHNYYYLDVPGMANTAGTILNQYALNSFLNQQYELQTASDGYFRIRPMHTKDEMFLTLAIDETRTDGAGIIELQARQDSAYQEFKFVQSTDHTYRLVCKASPSDAFCMEVPNGAYGYPVQVKYAPCTGNGEAWQRISLESVGGIIRTSAGYTADRNYTTSVTDATGNTTQYQYNEDTGFLQSVTNAKGQTTTYTYDLDKRLTKVSDGVEEVTYTYNNQNRSSKISIPSGTNYYLYYDSFGNVTNVMASGMELIRNTYESNNGNLLSSTYGDGSNLSYTYDSFDRVTQKLYNNVVAVEYLYDSLGRIYSKNDALANRIIRYEYDFNDRITSLRSNDGLYQTCTYDNRNRMLSYTNGIGNISQTTGFLYGEKATVGFTGQKVGYLYGVTVNGEQTQSYEYDYLSRLISKRLDGSNNYQVRYEYYQGPNNAGTAKTTGMVSAVVNGNTRLEYTYDELGNISSYSKNGVLQESYTYDNQNQLSTVTKGSDVWQYSYGYNGNLSQVKKNGVVVKDYQYDSPLWSDVLSQYNGREVIYGKDNNLYQYHDGREFTWQNGRWLVGINGNVGSQNQDIDYAYNSEGLRISKTVNGVHTEFYWLDGCLMGQKTGNEYIVYLYDGNSGIYGFLITDGVTEEYYYYLFNLQGDIIGILDEQGNQVVEYSYDVWGYPLDITGTMASTIGQKNPLRYRGYYFDSETGFYYLNTRYYDPELGRFISADGYVSTGQGMSGHNMFAYCGNNPVNRGDPDGEGWLTVLFVAAVVGVFLTGCGKNETPNQEPQEEINIPRERIVNARDLNIDDASPGSYNCFGNGISKEVWDHPMGYEAGDSTEKTFSAVVRELGEDNVRRLDSIDDPIAHDEYKVALNCGPTDYHFIRQDDFGWYYKTGRDPGFYVNTYVVSANTWQTLIFDNGRMDVLEPSRGGHIYDYGPIYFAVKVGWDDR